MPCAIAMFGLSRLIETAMQPPNGFLLRQSIRLANSVKEIGFNRMWGGGLDVYRRRQDHKQRQSFVGEQRMES